MKPKEEEKEIIIPLIKTNNWKTQVLRKAGTGRAEKENNIDSQAVKELIEGMCTDSFIIIQTLKQQNNLFFFS